MVKVLYHSVFPKKVRPTAGFIVLLAMMALGGSQAVAQMPTSSDPHLGLFLQVLRSPSSIGAGSTALLSQSKLEQVLRFCHRSLLLTAPGRRFRSRRWVLLRRPRIRRFTVFAMRAAALSARSPAAAHRRPTRVLRRGDFVTRLKTLRPFARSSGLPSARGRARLSTITPVPMGRSPPDTLFSDSSSITT